MRSRSTTKRCWPTTVATTRGRFTSTRRRRPTNPYGGLIASGGYTITLMYRLGHQIYNVPGRRWAVLGASEWHLKFPAPVRSGDRVRLRITIKDKRESSRPRRGHFDLLYELLNQAGNIVLSVLVAGLIERRLTSLHPPTI